jgi:hypothetical protein
MRVCATNLDGRVRQSCPALSWVSMLFEAISALERGVILVETEMFNLLKSQDAPPSDFFPRARFSAALLLKFLFQIFSNGLSGAHVIYT